MDVAPLTVTTILRRADFLRLNRGQKYITDHLILRALPSLAGASSSHASSCRIGYTVTTKCGNAVLRNRIKRRLRAVVRELLPQQGAAGMDYVLIARAEMAADTICCPLDTLREEISRAVQAINRRCRP